MSATTSKWGQRGNHDHVITGAAVYVLNTKNVKDSSITIEAEAVRLQRLDDSDRGYLADRWAPQAEREARSLKIELNRALAFPVHVYPVVVLWGRFDAGQAYVGNVSLVRGDLLVAWIKSRPADLPTAEKRQLVAQAVRALPRA